MSQVTDDSTKRLLTCWYTTEQWEVDARISNSVYQPHKLGPVKVSLHHNKVFNAQNVYGLFQEANDKMLSCSNQAKLNELRPSERQGEEELGAWSHLDLSLDPTPITWYGETLVSSFSSVKWE